MTASATTATATAAAALASPLFRRPTSFPAAASLLLPPSIASPQPAVAARRRVFCQVAISTDVSSSPAADEEAEAAAKVGRRVRVTVPLRVYHVLKVPELDLNGLEGSIKQYVGLHKGKRISANLPFKVEFQIEAEGQPRPVKFFAHLREDEFEYLPSSTD